MAFTSLEDLICGFSHSLRLDKYLVIYCNDQSSYLNGDIAVLFYSANDIQMPKAELLCICK